MNNMTSREKQRESRKCLGRESIGDGLVVFVHPFNVHLYRLETLSDGKTCVRQQVLMRLCEVAQLQMFS